MTYRRDKERKQRVPYRAWTVGGLFEIGHEPTDSILPKAWGCPEFTLPRGNQ